MDIPSDSDDSPNNLDKCKLLDNANKGSNAYSNSRVQLNIKKPSSTNQADTYISNIRQPNSEASRSSQNIS